MEEWAYFSSSEGYIFIFWDNTPEPACPLPSNSRKNPASIFKYPGLNCYKQAIQSNSRNKTTIECVQWLQSCKKRIWIAYYSCNFVSVVTVVGLRSKTQLTEIVFPHTLIENLSAFSVRHVRTSWAATKHKIPATRTLLRADISSTWFTETMDVKTFCQELSLRWFLRCSQGKNYMQK